ncbi:hypothetical protein [Sorangium cellulosum]|nr:hypothetical protein [Sorangium cellulosum]
MMPIACAIGSASASTSGDTRPFDWSALSADASSSRALFASCAGSDMNPPKGASYAVARA